MSLVYYFFLEHGVYTDFDNTSMINDPQKIRVSKPQCM